MGLLVKALFGTVCIWLFAAGAWAGGRAIVTTTDYSSGSISVVDLETHTASVNVLNIHSDAGIRTWGERVYVINRRGQDNILVLDSAALDTLISWKEQDDDRVLDPEALSTLVRQFSVGNGTNPQDIAFVSDTKAYVARLAVPRLLVVNPATGDSTGSVDLSFAADADGVPEVAYLSVYEGHLYAVCQRLNRDTQLWDPTDRSEVVVVDVNTDAVVDMDSEQAGLQGIVLAAKNPAGCVRVEGKLYLSCAGFRGANDGGIEVVDLASNRTDGVAIEESTLGGDVGPLAMVSDSRGYVVLSDASYVNSVRGFDLSTQEVSGPLAGTSGGFIADLGVLGDRLYVPDSGSWGDPESAGLRVYDVTDHSLLAGPISTGLPPSSVAFLAGVSAPEGPAADFDGDGAVGFSDFLLFVRAFQAFEGLSVYDAKFDLASDDDIDFDDFVLFAKDYGKKAGG